MPHGNKPNAGVFASHVSHGSLFLSKIEDINREPRLLPSAHYLRQAWNRLDLSGVLCVDGRPTVYLCEAKRFTTAQKRERQRFVWNQGLVPLLILLTPDKVEVHSGVAKPSPKDGPEDSPEHSLIPDLNRITETLECRKFVRSVETGQFFHERSDFFPPEQAVDRCLVRNLIDAAKKLRATGWKIDQAHALLGRVLFVSFLHQREFIKPHHFPEGTKSLLDIVKGHSVEEAKHLLYGKGGLFPTLKCEFNGTMFDSALAHEEQAIRKVHIDVIADFLGGAEMASRQLTLFSEYDFGVIPVETISAIYEEFMKDADLKRKHDEGTFYTPRHLAETTLYIALEDRFAEAAKWRVLDPACGSGIFLVAMFNLLAAQWLRANPGSKKKTKAQALLDILQEQIRGVDLNPDACRIAAFSLYLALFEKLQPMDLDEFKAKVRADHFLPPLFWSSEKDGPKAEPPVIMQGDFLADPLPLAKDYDLIIGNPPWGERAKDQTALLFSKQSLRFLREDGIGCLILPTTILVNLHGTLDGEWFRTVTVEKIVQLADYRKLMFASAIHAGFILRFQNTKPTLEHTVIYETPKVSRFDRRRGIIIVEPDDQKAVPQHAVIEASLHDKKQKHGQLQALWSRKFWGSPRDEALMRRLDFFPRLAESKQRMKWRGGVGFKPHYPGASQGEPEPIKPWKLTDSYLPNTSEFPQLVVTAENLWTLRKGLEASVHQKREIPASLEFLHRKPNDSTFQGPLVVFSNGFTKFAFSKDTIRFQDSLRSIGGKKDDSDLLRFLTAALGSRLMLYQAFHSGSSNGIGRDKLHLYESLNLPFPLPDDDLAADNAAKIVRDAAEIIKRVERDGKAAKAEDRAKLVEEAKQELEPLVEAYYSVSDTERILIADTLELWQPSIHKPNLDLNIPALKFPDDKDRKQYADTLAGELHRFTRKERIRISVEGMASEELNLVFVTVIFGDEKRPYRETGGDAELFKALVRVNKAAEKENGPISYLRGFTYCARDRVHILKPGTMRNWCRTAALNDADAVFEYLRGKRA